MVVRTESFQQEHPRLSAKPIREGVGLLLPGNRHADTNEQNHTLSEGREIVPRLLVWEYPVARSPRELPQVRG